MVLVIISILGSIVIIQMALPFFNQLTGKNISFGTENLLYFGSALAIITLITGLVAGSYPAFYLSSFQPAQVLKGKSALSHTSGWLRQSLVVFQFMIGIILVCGMIIIGKPLRITAGTWSVRPTKNIAGRGNGIIQLTQAQLSA